jgi:hypothetical protein
VTTYRVEVTYRQGEAHVHKGLTAEQAIQASFSFPHDLVYLEGRGVWRFVLEVEQLEAEQQAQAEEQQA